MAVPRTPVDRPIGGPDAFFTTRDGRWFAPTELARGPWDPDACHAGPPTGLLARGSERAVPGQPLVRLTVDLVRPVPMTGFAVEAEVTRAGRSVSTTRISLQDAEGRELLAAHGSHVADLPEPLTDPPTAAAPGPVLADAAPARFPIRAGGLHGFVGFTSAIEPRVPPGHDTAPGPRTLWLRTPPLLPDEEPSPFQRICPIADCGNAVSRNAEPSAEPGAIAFMNTDLTIHLHRTPEGEWFASESVSHWQATGHGMSDSVLHDARGPVGRAVQSLILRAT